VEVMKNKKLRIFGLVCALSYVVVVLLTWAYMDIQGYKFVVVSEPIIAIKYTEWLMGGLSIGVLLSYLIDEVNRWNRL
jgi:hypothetical protein